MPETHILVVDDEPAIRFSLGAFLEDRGYKVSQAGSGAEARALFRTETIHKAVIDMRLPDISGEELILELLPIHPQTQFFIFTGSLEYTPPPHLQDRGITVQRVLHKPLLDLDQLLRALGLVVD